MNKYIVMLDNHYCMETCAVSPAKAINNVRYKLFQQTGGWWNVPRAERFDVVEA